MPFRDQTNMSRAGKKQSFSFPITALVGSSLPNFINLRKDYRIDRAYIGRYTLTIFLSALLEPFRWWENLRWNRSIRKTDLKKPPVFIIGFWRSGTTMLHELLCQAEDTSYVTTFQTVFPHLVLGQSWWLKPLANNMMPANRPFDNVDMSLDFPQEEEIAMASIQRLSFYNFLYFPGKYKHFYHRDLFFRNATENEIWRWKLEYLHLIRKALLNVKGERFISKNPSNMARIPVLLEMFPDAKFIFIYRNPYQVVESFYGFLMSVVPAIQLQKFDKDLSHNLVAKLYADMVHFYEGSKKLIPPGNLVEIKYEDLARDPLAAIQGIYQQFNLESFGKDVPRMRSYLEKSRELRKNHYEISAHTVELVNQYLMDILKKWNYEVKS
jgi:hypothetical protein